MSNETIMVLSIASMAISAVALLILVVGTMIIDHIYR